MINVIFKIVDSQNQYIRSTLYITPLSVPNSSSGAVIVGDTISEILKPTNWEPSISLYPARYAVRVAGNTINTQFNVDLSAVSDGTTVSASAYIE